MEKSLVTLYISCMDVLVFQRKPCLYLMKTLNSLKYVQQFAAHNSNCKKEKEKKKEENV